MQRVPLDRDWRGPAIPSQFTSFSRSLAYEVSKRPDIGLALAVHTSATAIFHRRSINAYADCHCCVRIAATKEREATRTPDADNCAAFDLLSAAAERVRALLPSEQSALLAWCLAADRKTLLDVLAYCVASQIDGQAQFLTDGKLRAADAIAEAVGLDMIKYWSPSESFGKRISKKTLAAAAIEAGAPAPTAKTILDAPKADAVRIACEALKPSGWTPPPMRPSRACRGAHRRAGGRAAG